LYGSVKFLDGECNSVLEKDNISGVGSGEKINKTFSMICGEH
jgi:hypothetical protein